MNYQYRYGTSTTQAMKHLWQEGKIRRFYRGYGPALLQGPISRFGDTAANVGILALLEAHDLPIAVKTGAASVTAGLWRITIMPIDTLKTTLQVRDKRTADPEHEKFECGTFTPYQIALWKIVNFIGI